MRLNKMRLDLFGVDDKSGKYICNGCRKGCGGFVFGSLRAADAEGADYP